MKAFAVRAVLSGGSVLRDRAILVDGERIAGVIERERARDFTDEVEDLGNAFALPGLANTHTHLAMTAFRGIGDGLRLESWLRMVWDIEARLREDLLFHANVVGLYEVVSSGVTALLDFYDVWPFANAVVEAGHPLRAFAGLAFMDRVEYMKEESWRRIKAVNDYAERLKGMGVGLFLSPHSLYANSMEMLKELGRLNYGLFQTHFLETEGEEASIVKNLGVGPVEALRETGLIEKERLILAHAVYAGKYIRDIARPNVFVSTCPISNSRLYSGVAPIPEMLALGVNVSLGTDGAGSSDTLDMLEQVKALVYVNRGVNRSRELKLLDALTIASRNGYAALGLNGGDIREGMLADFFTVDLDMALPYLDTPGLIYQATRHMVKDVVVGGRFIKKDHKVSFEERFRKSRERLADFMGGMI